MGKIGLACSLLMLLMVVIGWFVGVSDVKLLLGLVLSGQFRILYEIQKQDE